MNVEIDEHASLTQSALHERLRRHKLVFVQHGAVFDGLTDAITEASASPLVQLGDVVATISDPIIHVFGVEAYAVGQSVPLSLGELRKVVSELLDNDVQVCLWSRAPKVSFAPVPGSSLLDDASPFFIPPMAALPGDPGSVFPAVRQGQDLSDVLYNALSELGVHILAALDRAIFDAQLDRETMFDILDAREIEALRGAGLVQPPQGGTYQLCAPQRFVELREQLAAALAEHVDTQTELPRITEGMWNMERKIRRSLRAAAKKEIGSRWRTGVLHGDLNDKVLERAQVGGYVSATSLSQLRDPIEWLTMGELIEVVTSAKFGGLGLSKVFWAKFSQEVVPVRNRLSHMRHFKHGDKELVRMWVAQVDRALG